MMIFAIAGGVILIPMFYFGCAMLLWLAGRLVINSQIVYIKYLELFGITSWIHILGRFYQLH